MYSTPDSSVYEEPATARKSRVVRNEGDFDERATVAKIATVQKSRRMLSVKRAGLAMNKNHEIIIEGDLAEKRNVQNLHIANSGLRR